MKLRLEDKLVKALGPGDYYDLVRRRLVLRVREDSRRYVIRYRIDGGDPTRYTVGNANVMTLAEARQKAKTLLADVDKGTDPHEERRQKREAVRKRRLGETVAQAVAAWLADTKHGPAARWKGGLSGGTWAMPHVNRLKRTLGDRPLAELTPQAVEKFVSEPEAAATRNRALTTLRLFIGWAKRKGLVEADPSAGLLKEHEQERTRTLSDDELRAMVCGFDATRYGRAVRLLVLTGLRRDEALVSRWEWYDLKAGIMTIPPAAEKTGRTRGERRRVALSPAAVDLLTEQREAQLAEGSRSDFVFATSTGSAPHSDALKPILYRLRGRRSNGLQPSKDKRARKREAVLPDDVTIHDLRRTVADALLTRLRVAPWIVDNVVLGHARPKLQRTYMPTLPLDEAREALEQWAEMLAGILAAKAAKAKA